MGVSSVLSSDGLERSIIIGSRFDAAMATSFRQAYEGCDGQPKSYKIDLGKTEYLDSSALGLLLMLRDHTGFERENMQLINCKPGVKKILAICNFDDLFEVA